MPLDLARSYLLLKKETKKGSQKATVVQSTETQPISPPSIARKKETNEITTKGKGRERLRKQRATVATGVQTINKYSLSTSRFVIATCAIA